MAEDPDVLENEGEFDSRSFYFLLDSVVKCPSHQQRAIDEVLSFLRKVNFDVKCLKTSLEFYRSLYPTATASLERKLFVGGVLSEDDISKLSISSFLSEILFQVVTTSSTDCAEYCANVWLERVQAQQKDPLIEPIKKGLPNPLDFINSKDLTQSGSAILASFNSLTTEQRLVLLQECAELLERIPSHFYPRVMIGLFVFVDLYKSQLNMDSDCCPPEFEAWSAMWIHLLASSLLGKFKSSLQAASFKTQPSISSPSVHHILCGLMIATGSFKLIKCFPATARKVLKGLEQMIVYSSGFTVTWLRIMKFYFASD